MIRVLVVSPVRLISDLIQTTCREQPDIQVVGAVASKQDALAFASNCDVMLISAALPDGGGLELIQALDRQPNAPATVIVGLPDTESLLLRYLEAGAAGCIREKDSAQELLRAIRIAAASEIALNSDLIPAVLKRVHALAAELADSSNESSKDLTRREREVLDLIAQGYGNREIARSLTIELGTTKNHVHNILDKLNVRSRRDAAMYFALGMA